MPFLLQNSNQTSLIAESFICLDLIEGLVPDRSDDVNRKLKTFYDSCMDIESIRTKGFIPGWFYRE